MYEGVVRGLKRVFLPSLLGGSAISLEKLGNIYQENATFLNTGAGIALALTLAVIYRILNSHFSLDRRV